MQIKTPKGYKLIEITSNRNERVCSDLKVKNDQGETLHIINRYYSNHKKASDLFDKSDGVHYWTNKENYANLVGDSTNNIFLEEG